MDREAPFFDEHGALTGRRHRGPLFPLGGELLVPTLSLRQNQAGKGPPCCFERRVSGHVFAAELEARVSRQQALAVQATAPKSAGNRAAGR